MPAEGDFSGRTVCLTGAGGGLGSALVEIFASRGARVIGCDRPGEDLSGLHLAATHAFDLLDHAAAETAANEIIGQHGLPDVLVNNAGWTRAETITMLNRDNTEREVDLNLTGVMVFTNPLAKAMAARGKGSIVFISSVNAISHFGNAAYAAAKAGINAYARAIAVELGRQGVRSNVVCPGSIRTHAWEHRLAKDKNVLDKLRELYPLGRIVEAREVAEAVAFLASDRASGITGTVLPVDAGITAGYLPFIDNILG